MRSFFIKRGFVALFWCARLLFRKWLFVIRYPNRAVKIEPSTRISRRAVIRISGGGSITIGKNCEIHDFAMIMTYGGDITIGDNCSLNPFAIIYGHGGVRIGNGVRIAAHTVIVPANHNIPVDGQPIHLSGISARGIDIGDHVWLGSGSRVLDGVHIGRNAIVGAGGVVTKSVPDFATVAGVPARVIDKS